jgi:cytochrome P450
MDDARPAVKGCPFPDHIPPDLVRDFSIYTSPGLTKTAHGDPHAAAVAATREAPPLFYSPSNAFDGSGSWVATRAEDQRKIMGDPQAFSSKRKWIFDESLGPDFILRPLENDPPLHTQYRELLNPLLSPKRVEAMEADVRARAVSLIEGFKSRGHCDVMSDFAFPFAVGVFLQFMGIDQGRRDEFIGWVEDLFHRTVDDRKRAVKRVTDFMKDLMERRQREAADDFMSFLLAARIEGRALEEIEIVGLGTLLFNGGLDTVATHIGLNLYHLARNPADQTWMREHPEAMKSAVEELLRAYATVTPLRRATRDVEFKGVLIKAGEVVSCPSMIANRDPAEFPEPDRIDFLRENNRHTAFAYGPHRCLGSHLARREIVIAMEEMLSRLPPFRIKEGTTPVTHGGYVFGVDDLVLDWT